MLKDAAAAALPWEQRPQQTARSGSQEVKGQRSQKSCLKLRVISVKADEEEEEENRERWRMQKDQQGGDRKRRIEKQEETRKRRRGRKLDEALLKIMFNDVSCAGFL